MSTQKRARDRRWPRLVIPYAVILTVLIGCAVAYNWEQPDPTNRAYLSPTSDDDLGAHRLAVLLAQRNVSITETDHTSDALVEAGRAPAGVTLFIPAPELVHPFYLRMIKLLPATTNVVIVGASTRVLSLGNIAAVVTAQRLASAALAPRCQYAPAVRAGTASVYRMRYEGYDGPDHSCYSGGLAVVRREGVPVTLVGADDPFRNDRIGEYNNATLATELLAGRSRVVWVNLHRAEARPRYVDDPRLASQEAAPPSLGPGSPDPDFPLPNGFAKPSFSAPPGGQGTTQHNPPNPLWRAFPAWVFAAVALTALAAVLLALARGRRLSGPVSEPLPIVVRATETVEGRSRLYRRAKARGPALAMLRERATLRLTHLLGLKATAPPHEILAAVATASRWTPDAVTRVLHTDEPADDRALIAAALALERLVHAVAHQAPRPDFAHEGDPR